LVDLTDVSPANSALLVIDMSRDFRAARRADGMRRAMAKPLAALLARCREQRLPVIYVNHLHREGGCDKGTLAHRFPAIRDGRALRAGTRGVEIWEELTPQPGDIIVEKIRQSGFTYTSLEAVLRELGVRNVIVSGVSTGARVECTARDAVSRDFNVIFLSDGTASSGIPDLGWGPVDGDPSARVPDELRVSLRPGRHHPAGDRGPLGARCTGRHRRHDLRSDSTPSNHPCWRHGVGFEMFAGVVPGRGAGRVIEPGARFLEETR
jgi:nicotinamidase-related amidase